MNANDLEILLERDDFVVVNKPSGLLTQAPPGIDSLEDRIRRYATARRDSSSVPALSERPVYVGIPHRLDRPASGAMVFALRKRVARKLAKAFERRQVKKTYWACVSGLVAPPAGIWEDFIRKIPNIAESEIVPEDHPGGQRARLRYRTLAATEVQTWLEIQLETGRTHQIRVQSAWRGYPVLGDRQYGSLARFGPKYEDPRDRAIALHARAISFPDPSPPVNESSSSSSRKRRGRSEADRADRQAQNRAWSLADGVITVVAPPPDAWNELGKP